MVMMRKRSGTACETSKKSDRFLDEPVGKERNSSVCDGGSGERVSESEAAVSNVTVEERGDVCVCVCEQQQRSVSLRVARCRAEPQEKGAQERESQKQSELSVKTGRVSECGRGGASPLFSLFFAFESFWTVVASLCLSRRVCVCVCDCPACA